MLPNTNHRPVGRRVHRVHRVWSGCVRLCVTDAAASSAGGVAVIKSGVYASFASVEVGNAAAGGGKGTYPVNFADVDFGNVSVHLAAADRGGVVVDFGAVRFLGGLWDATSAKDGGGAMAADDSEVVVTAVTVRDCHASRGGVVDAVSSNVFLENVSIIGASATGSSGGGALHVEGLYLSAVECVFAQCTAATGSGGAVALMSSDADFAEVVMEGSRANDSGGAVWATRISLRTDAVSTGTSVCKGGALFLCGRAASSADGSPCSSS
eukprot:TRINITY_DN2453_c0_g1_i1.p1 TRINITY_DN2453_c0_g1~~TRINITY_DN2453_c0_g1_i1.p1  ORF type:complete len:267 (+),score=54.27 TRINITY_DN2453_c0_g1_i1:421-1221(+)